MTILTGAGRPMVAAVIALRIPALSTGGASARARMAAWLMLLLPSFVL